MKPDKTFIAVIIFTLYHHIVSKVLDSGVLHVPIHESYFLKCQNKTEGRFHSLVWRTSAYSIAKHDVYSYMPNRKEEVYEHFSGRLKRFNGTSLNVKKAKPEDSGNWECNILFYYKYGDQWRLKVRVMAVYDVVIVSPPTITRRYPKIVSVLKGYQANAFCDAHGLSPFNLTWKKEDGELSNNVNVVEKYSMKGKYFSQRIFMYFLNMSLNNIGNYTCVAKNQAGRAMLSINVKMQERPKIISRNTERAHEGQKGMVLCEATGYPRVHFTWKLMSNLFLKSGGSDGNFLISETVYTAGKKVTASSKLHIHVVSKKDWRVYTCIAESSIGHDSLDITLTGFSLPSPPKILPTKKIYANQVHLRWKLGEDGGSPINSITVQYKKNIFENWSTIQISRPLKEYTATNLETNSIYDFRVLCASSVGNSRYSEVLHVQTTPREVKVVRQKQTIGSLGIISFIAVCGAALVGLTCTIGCICLYSQEKRLNRSSQDSRQDNRSGTLSLVDPY